ncbi:MAG: hypothetical protein ACI4T2_02795 [Christensenellales bacterium]
MKKKGKSLLTYILILLGIALGVFAICIAVLVLAPGKAIAGFVYSKVSQNDTVYAYLNNSDSHIYSETYYSEHLGADRRMLDANDVQSLVINAGAHDVVVRQMKQDQKLEGTELTNSVDKFAFVISSYYSGIYKQSKYPNGVDFNIFYDKDQKVLTLNFNTPSGLNFNRSGNIIVDIPEAFYHLSNSVKTGTNILGSTTATLTIFSDSGDVNLGGWNEPGSEVRSSSMANVNIETNKGDITLNENFYPCGEMLNLKSQKGKISNTNTINQTNMTMNLSSGSGEVNFSSADIIVKELNIYSEKADIKLHDIDLGSLNNALNWSGNRGRCFANNINGSLLGHEDASATNFSINYISGQFYLPKGDTCDVNIEKIDGKVKIISTNNNISIKNASSAVIIQTQKGSVYLENCTSSIDLSSTRAPVTLKDCSGEIRIKTTKGKISGSIKDIVGTNNYLNTEDSVIDVMFDQNMAFNLSASSAKRDISINYASISDKQNKFDLQINGGDTSKKMTLYAKYEISISNIKGE